MKYLIFLFVLVGTDAFPQNGSSVATEIRVDDLVDSLWTNPTSFFNNNDPNWRLLCDNLQQIDLHKLNQLSSSIFTGSEAMIENESTSSQGFVGSLNRGSQERKIKK